MGRLMPSNNSTTRSPLYIAESVFIRILPFRLAILANVQCVAEVAVGDFHEA